MTNEQTIVYFSKKYGRPPQSGKNDHYLAMCRIASLLENFYYDVKIEYEASVEMLKADHLTRTDEDRKDFFIDVMARYPKHPKHNGNWIIKFEALAVEILNKYPGAKTGHKSKKAFNKDQTRKRVIKEKYHNIFVEFDARDISQIKRFKKLGLYTILQELGIIKIA